MTITVPSVDPTIGVEEAFAELLGPILSTDRPSPDSHFFDELGADSMTMARFCARVRKRDDLPSISIKDVYEHPTIRSLAAALADAAPASVEPSVPPPVAPATPASTRQHIVCGVLQILCFLGYAYAAALGAAFGYDWMTGGSG